MPEVHYAEAQDASLVTSFVLCLCVLFCLVKFLGDFLFEKCSPFDKQLLCLQESVPQLGKLVGEQDHAHISVDLAEEATK
jgi:hypothetical protein